MKKDNKNWIDIAELAILIGALVAIYAISVLA